MTDYEDGWDRGLRDRVSGEDRSRTTKMYKKILKDEGESEAEREFARGYLDGVQKKEKQIKVTTSRISENIDRLINLLAEEQGSATTTLEIVKSGTEDWLAWIKDKRTLSEKDVRDLKMWLDGIYKLVSTTQSH